MDEKQYTDLAVHVQEIDSRCKSNEHRIDDLENDMKETKKRWDSISMELLKIFIIGVAGFLLAQALPGVF